MRLITILFSFSILSIFISCDSDKPKKLLSEKEMASIIADFAIYEQNIDLINPEITPDSKASFVLKKHKTTKDVFKSSYTYYLSKPEKIQGILNESEKIILNKDPKLKDTILKQNPTSTEEK